MTVDLPMQFPHTYYYLELIPVVFFSLPLRLLVTCSPNPTPTPIIPSMPASASGVLQTRILPASRLLHDNV